MVVLRLRAMLAKEEELAAPGKGCAPGKRRQIGAEAGRADCGAMAGADVAELAQSRAVPFRSLFLAKCSTSGLQ